MYVLLFDDDSRSAMLTKKLIASVVEGCEVEVADTESAALAMLETLTERDALPELFVIDMMLRWAEPHPENEPAPSDRDIYSGGARIVQSIRDNDSFAAIPILVLTVLNASTFQAALRGQSGVTVVRKSASTRRLESALTRLVGKRTR